MLTIEQHIEKSKRQKEVFPRVDTVHSYSIISDKQSFFRKLYKDNTAL